MKHLFLSITLSLISGICFSQIIPIGNDNGQEFIDLGLPSHNLWATYNIGASGDITDDGDKYQWADIIALEKTLNNEDYIASGNYATESTAPYIQKENGVWNYTKYNASDNITVLEFADDAVALEMGGDWHIPTKEDFEELIEYTDQEWVDGNAGTAEGGMYFYNKEDHESYIFLPAAETAVRKSYYENWAYDFDINKQTGHMGWYWSSSVDTNNYLRAYHLNFNKDYVEVRSSTRFGGRNLRGVIAGEPDHTTIISEIKPNKADEAKSYNMFGLVANKGLIIRNGKKMFIK